MIGKILTGALIGVGAVAAAPFTGGGSLLGAATLASSLAGAGAAAAGAGAVGAAVGAVVADSQEKEQSAERSRAKESGKQEATAGHILEKEKLEKKLQQMLAKVANREQFIVTCFALGVSCANADGEVSKEEIEELSMFAAGVGQTELLSAINRKLIKEMIDTPPSLASVIEMIKKHGFDSPKYTELFSQIIHVVIEADGRRDSKEKQFLKEWNTVAA